MKKSIPTYFNVVKDKYYKQTTAQFLKNCMCLSGESNALVQFLPGAFFNCFWLKFQHIYDFYSRLRHMFILNCSISGEPASLLQTVKSLLNDCIAVLKLTLIYFDTCRDQYCMLHQDTFLCVLCFSATKTWKLGESNRSI